MESNERPISFTEDDLTSELRQLHTSSHPERQSGEFSIAEYAKATGLTIKQAGAELNYMLLSGKVERPPKRYIDSHMQVVYKRVG
jgi:predicted Rossmann fold nucleotide-binding protein DprA/Smf involved in DNA uptake